MGVTGLWTVLHPVARPIKLETLSQKRLAIDASIWIYQFLKAVRDKEGNALRNSHVVGFFRRICKLLFLGIKPVFVFDGGAPALKRQTINQRKRRREGRREDAVRTAGKLLAVQMQRRAEEKERRRKEELERGSARQEEEVPENIVYAEEVTMADKERQQNRKFKRKDAYHLPNLDVSLADMGQPNDPRIMSLEDLEEYARQFDAGEDINVYDFSKIDFDSPFFMSLPAGDRYNILNAARLRSRLRMGYSKDQLDTMFPDRMAFSKFQIERVAERNNLTQRLMNINGMNDDAFGINGSSRVSSEKGREYVLVKNDGVEGGWALGVVSGNKDMGKREKPIDIDEMAKREQESEEDDWDSDEFEDVPIEGLNRLPKLPPGASAEATEKYNKARERRRALYRSRRSTANKRRYPRKSVVEDPDSLFVADPDEDAGDWEEVGINGEALAPEHEDRDMDEGSDADLQRAIAMSLEQHGGSDKDMSSDEDEYREVFEQKRVEEARPFVKGRGMTIAHAANARSGKAAPQAVEDADSDDDEMDLQAALAESRRTKHLPKRKQWHTESKSAPAVAVMASTATAKASSSSNPFAGPLPFESLDLGSSLLGKKKMAKLADEAQGGFEKEDPSGKKDSKPLPPWFAGNLEKDLSNEKEAERQDRENDKRKEEEQAEFEFASKSRLRRIGTREVIDLDETQGSTEVIDLDGDEEVAQPMTIEIEDPEADSEQPAPVESTPNMGDLADRVRAQPPPPASTEIDPTPIVPEQHRDGDDPDMQVTSAEAELASDGEDAPLDWDESDDESRNKHAKSVAAPNKPKTPFVDSSDEDADEDFEDVAIDKSQSQNQATGPEKVTSVQPAGGALKKGPFVDFSPEPEDESFENVPMKDTASSPVRGVTIPRDDIEASAETMEATREVTELIDQTHSTSGLVAQELPPLDDLDPEANEAAAYSDPEDEELFRALMAEDNEHARFASELNHRTVEQNKADYERELKQLRTQQKKDRRDADEVTSTMVTECQQLLGYFGLPYITAPMEAEAQCAELVQLGLVDGIVTDDSDIFLFGGTRVYKNMFNQAKFVECYLSSDLEQEFGMTRKRLIALAQLLGSDYTEGLPGVGPVSAVELVGEFDDLVGFRSWWDEVQTGSSTISSEATKFRQKFRKAQGTKLFLPPSFPDPRVELAYLKPEVDSDPQEFQWGVPDLSALRSFLMMTIGWSAERTDEILVPVIKDMNTRQVVGVQRNITGYFGGQVGAGAFAPRVRGEGGSARLENALQRIGQKAKRQSGGDGEHVSVHANSTEATESAPAKKKTKAKARTGTKKGKAAAPEVVDEDDLQDIESDGSTFEAPKRKARKTNGKKKTKA